MSPFTPETDLKKSDIRIFCDNDKRWTKRDESLGGWGDDIKYGNGQPTTAITSTKFESGMIVPIMPVCNETGTAAATYSAQKYFAPGQKGKSHSVGKIQLESKLMAK